ERLGGPTDWALPYWNWDAPEGPGRLPVPFRHRNLAGGSLNQLFVAQRHPDANAGNRFATDADIDIQTCLTRTTFPGAGEFGGPPVRDHDTGVGGGFGSLEGTPHGSMHVAVGNPP